jgi:hypothetical protein
MESLQGLEALAQLQGVKGRVRIKPCNPQPIKEGQVQTREALEENTRGQNENPEWHKARHGRVTASKVGAILASYRPKIQHTDPRIRAKQNLARELVTAATFGPTEAMVHGTINEFNAMMVYAKRLDKNEHVEMGHGLHVHKEHGWLACSPDGVYKKDECMIQDRNGEWLSCDCPSTYKERRLVEVKCPFSKKDDCNFDDPKFYIHKVGNEYQLNMKSAQGRAYYYQIQTNLAILDLPSCDLVVWAPGRMEIVRVNRQTPKEEADMIATCKQFWHDHVERLINHSVYRPVVEPEEPMEAIAADVEQIVSRIRKKFAAPEVGVRVDDPESSDSDSIDGADGDL